MRRLALTAALLLHACGSCDATPSEDEVPEWLEGPGQLVEPREEPNVVTPDPSVPWNPGEGPRANVTGRVVTPGGDPIAGARVELIYGGDPHWPEALAYHADTDEEGRFAFRGVSAHTTFDMVVRHEGMERWFHPPPHPAEVTDRPPVEIRLGPTRAVPVRVRCREAPRHPRSEFDYSALELDVQWLPAGDAVASTTMGATDGTEDVLSGRGEPIMSRVRPNVVASIPNIPRDARRFAHELTLPIGRHRVIVSGPCGVVAREIDVAEGEGPTEPVEIEAPATDHADLEVRLSATSQRQEVFPLISFHGTHIEHPYELRAGEPIRIQRVAPGLYVIDHVTCHEPIEVAPRGTTTVTIGPGSCEVSHRAR